MHIIVEGIDRCGKSSVIREMQRLLPHYEVKKPTAPSNELQALRIYSEFFLALSWQGNVIWDRGHISEMVYSSMYRDYSITNQLLSWENSAMRSNPFITVVYYFPIWQTLLSDDEARPNADRLAELHTYGRMLDLTALTAMRQPAHKRNAPEWIPVHTRAYTPLTEMGILGAP